MFGTAIYLKHLNMKKEDALRIFKDLEHPDEGCCNVLFHKDGIAVEVNLNRRKDTINGSVDGEEAVMI